METRYIFLNYSLLLGKSSPSWTCHIKNIWNICYSGPGCAFVWVLRTVYLSAKQLCCYITQCPLCCAGYSGNCRAHLEPEERRPGATRHEFQQLSLLLITKAWHRCPEGLNTRVIHGKASWWTKHLHHTVAHKYSITFCSSRILVRLVRVVHFKCHISLPPRRSSFCRRVMKLLPC